ncbi:MAG: ATP-dependent exonuclease [Flavobacteriaceae bacterium]|nr:ATP-dependent exonuclease [Flavobacteriaceae bacterium]
MKNTLLNFQFLFFSTTLIFSQPTSVELEPFKAGEKLEYRVHYGIFNASYASLTLSNGQVDGQELLLASGYGKTIGLARLFFKVEDYYSSYFETKEVQPILFKRNIYEGGYTKNLEVSFNSEKMQATVNNIKKGTTDIISIKDNVQDLISSLYYLRKNFSENKINTGDFFTINMFYDSKNRELALKYLGKEVIRTKYGKIECLKLMPTTNKSRIFKGEGSITIWLTNDVNKIPIRVQADLLVGSIKADLNEYSGIVSPLLIKQKS